MTVESVNFISDLDPVRPQGGDSIAQGDDHIRNIKKALKQTFPNIDGEVRASDEEINHLIGVPKPITEIIDDANQDVTDLDVRVTKNEQDIAQNKTDIAQNEADIAQNKTDIAQNKSDIADLRTDLNTGAQDLTTLEGKVDANTAAIANKADKSYEAKVDANTAEIAKKADKTYVDGELAKKADKSDLNNIDNYDHWKLAVWGDANALEVGSGDFVYLREGYGVDIRKTTNTILCSITQALKDQIDGNEQGVTDNASDIATLQNLVSDLQAQVGNLGGGMITATQQPATAGDFTVQGMDQTYRASVAVSGSINKTLQVPAGKVFCFEYLFGTNSSGGLLRVDIDQIYIDGVKMYPTNQGYVEYDQNGGSVWPGQDRGPLIKVKDKIEIKAMANYVSESTLCLAGFFTEA